MYLSLLNENIEKIKLNYKNKPFFAFISLNNICNANCVFCDVRENKEKACSVDIYKLVDELVQLGTKYIYFTGGGEPFTDKNVIDYMKYASSKGINIVFITNGYLMDEKLVQRLRGVNLKAVFISLDSHLASVHDKLRRTDGIFYKATNAITLLKKYYPNVKINLNHVINKDNIDDFEKFIRLKEKYNFDFINPILIKDCESLIPTQEQIGKFNKNKDNYLKMFDELNLRLLCDTMDIFSKGIDNHGNRQQNQDMRCYFGNYSAFIDCPTGKVYPCDCSIHRDRNIYCLGDLHTNTFSEIWQAKQRRDLIKKLNEGKLECKTKCDESNCLFNKHFLEG